MDLQETVAALNSQRSRLFLLLVERELLDFVQSQRERASAGRSVTGAGICKNRVWKREHGNGDACMDGDEKADLNSTRSHSSSSECALCFPPFPSFLRLLVHTTAQRLGMRTSSLPLWLPAGGDRSKRVYCLLAAPAGSARLPAFCYADLIPGTKNSEEALFAAKDSWRKQIGCSGVRVSEAHQRRQSMSMGGDGCGGGQRRRVEVLAAGAAARGASPGREEERGVVVSELRCSDDVDGGVDLGKKPRAAAAKRAAAEATGRHVGRRIAEIEKHASVRVDDREPFGVHGDSNGDGVSVEGGGGGVDEVGGAKRRQKGRGRFTFQKVPLQGSRGSSMRGESGEGQGGGGVAREERSKLAERAGVGRGSGSPEASASASGCTRNDDEEEGLEVEDEEMRGVCVHRVKDEVLLWFSAQAKGDLKQKVHEAACSDQAGLSHIAEVDVSSEHFSHLDAPDGCKVQQVEGAIRVHLSAIDPIPIRVVSIEEAENKFLVIFQSKRDLEHALDVSMKTCTDLRSMQQSNAPFKLTPLSGNSQSAKVALGWPSRERATRPNSIASLRLVQKALK